MKFTDKDAVPEEEVKAEIRKIQETEEKIKKKRAFRRDVR